MGVDTKRIQAILTADVPAEVADALLASQCDEFVMHVPLNESMTYKVCIPLTWTEEDA